MVAEPVDNLIRVPFENLAEVLEQCSILCGEAGEALALTERQVVLVAVRHKLLQAFESATRF